jgi:hypothetical protein
MLERTTKLKKAGENEENKTESKGKESSLIIIINPEGQDQKDH